MNANKQFLDVALAWAVAKNPKPTEAEAQAFKDGFEAAFRIAIEMIEPLRHRLDAVYRTVMPNAEGGEYP